MKNCNVILRVDVSKLSLDICCAERGLHLKTGNDSKGLTSFQKWCKTQEIDLKTAMVVMEHTGGYEYRLILSCKSMEIAYCRVSGLEIKQSLGITR